MWVKYGLFCAIYTNLFKKYFCYVVTFLSFLFLFHRCLHLHVLYRTLSSSSDNMVIVLLTMVMREVVESTATWMIRHHQLPQQDVEGLSSVVINDVINSSCGPTQTSSTSSSTDRRRRTTPTSTFFFASTVNDVLMWTRPIHYYSLWSHDFMAV